ncbi:MAG: methyltransferase domain-containing protein [Devosia sp.]
MTNFQNYLAPETLSPLSVQGNGLVSGEGHVFPLVEGIPNLVWPAALDDQEHRTQVEYDRVAERIYDAALNWQFAALNENEEDVRELMVNMLGLKPGARILEVGCGTGRDSYRLARRLDASGELYLQDLSSGMVHTCRRRMEEYGAEFDFQCTLHYSVSNAGYLPFPDGLFDAVFHFGGFNEFSDKPRAAAEFARVTKLGGTVLFGDESIGPWLRDQEFGKIVTTNNPLFAHPLPLETLPPSAHNVNVRWVMANCFYVISFVKGDGPPPLNLDLKHEGWRGGSMRSRYFGVMEGVTPEAKEMAKKAAADAGLSIHDWLDQLVRKESTRGPADGEPTP